MLFHTHILLGIVFFLFTAPLFPHANQLVFLLVVLLGSIFPDIDERRSKMNRWSGCIGSIVAWFSTHRGLFHSLLFAGIFSFLVGYFWHSFYGWGLFVGYLAHLVGDSITPMGIKPLYPFLRWRIRGPLRVGGFTEGIVLLGLAVVIILHLFS
jgi:inner membrane protein